MTAALTAARRSTLARHLLLAAVGVVVIVVVTGQLSDFHNYELATLGAYICAVAGLSVLTGTNGQVSLGHAALMAVGAYTVALLQQHFENDNVTGQWVLPLSLLIGSIVTLLVGVIVGMAAARLRGPYLAGATLAFGVAVPSITSQYTSIFKGDQGLPVTYDGPPASLGANFSLERWQAWYSLFAALLVLVLLANVHRSALGRHLRAVRDNEIAASLSGLSPASTRVLAFALSAAAAGLGGGVFAVALEGASPGSFGLTLSLTLVSAVVIGGLGNLAGAVWGSIIVVYLSIVLPGFVDRLHLSSASAQKLHDNLPPAVYGALLIVVMLVLPGGVQSLLRGLIRHVPHRSSPTPSKEALHAEVHPTP